MLLPILQHLKELRDAKNSRLGAGCRTTKARTVILVCTVLVRSKQLCLKNSASMRLRPQTNFLQESLMKTSGVHLAEIANSENLESSGNIWHQREACGGIRIHDDASGNICKHPESSGSTRSLPESAGGMQNQLEVSCSIWTHRESSGLI